jgi:hypothetical protein
VNIYAPKKPSRINSVSITFTVVGLALAYFLWAFIPIYWPIFQLKGICRAACNDAYRVTDDDEVIKRLVRDAARTGLGLTEDNFRMTREPYTEDELVALTAKIEDVDKRAEWTTFLRDRGKTCVIEYLYRGRYTLPVVGQSVELTFNDEIRGSLESVNW